MATLFYNRLPRTLGVGVGLLIIAAGVFQQAVLAQTTFQVSSAQDIANAMQSAGPGDVLEMTDGVWTDQSIVFQGNGNSLNPIILRPQTPGGVILTGTSNLKIAGDYLHVEGLHFKDGNALAAGHVVQFRNGSSNQATNSRFTNSVIESYNPPSQNDRYHWVSLYGENNRVDHNHFIDHDHSGVTVVAWLNDGATDPVNHRIDSNHFADRPEGNGNGFESIRLGTSSRATQAPAIIVENNLFERADGEIEIISNKSGDNTFRYNTFRDSVGTLTLRHGRNAEVTGNFFLGENKNGSGGIRVVGEDHTITNNYIEAVDDRADGAISITAGIASTPANGYEPVKNVTIAHNTIANVGGAGIDFDWLYDPSDGQTVLAENVTIAANIIANTFGDLFEGQEGVNWTWADNLVFGAPLGIPSRPGITIADPLLSRDVDGLLRPGTGSPAIDGGTPGLVNFDFDGQPRIGLPDIGADENSTAQIVRKPLEATDVGVDWSNDPGPGPGPFLVIEAEDTSEILDPDGDGVVWTILNLAEASGGQVLNAADSSRPDLTTEPHESLAVYDITFGEEGLYTAYYLARGFATNSDSFFSPTDLGVDPDIHETTSSNGIFDWIEGEQYDISTANVGVPLEFRLGSRERFSQLDAIIFHPDGNLTDVELTALLEVPMFELGDFDNDGDVDLDDLDQYIGNLGMAATGELKALDLDDDGTVNVDDFALHYTSLVETSNGGKGTFAGDINLDGVVNVLGDAFALVGNLGNSATSWAQGDINGDGTVNVLGDAFLLVGNLGSDNGGVGSSASNGAVPEPSNLSLLLLTTGGFFARRKRIRGSLKWPEVLDDQGTRKLI